ncbi:MULTISPECIES: PadR family transcriptional regulator [Bacillus]|uniref:PadR family transcriptional regulator n=1 Tax=Bacillus TaxID=1386 RepID=UPI0004261CDF|nr:MULTISPECIES: PadR family transcriptional regulator [Bacillus]QHZ46895.1 PadR family transcriptional regulator [Bacillus sp. NSP9.1]
MNKEMLKGNIDLLILSVLKEKENYGYEISKTIKEKTEGTFEIQEATLYLSLKRLEKQGAVNSYWGNESHGGRRKYYAITEDGIRLHENMVSDWKKMNEMVKRFI